MTSQNGEQRLQSLVGAKGEFTASWGEVCPCEVTGIEEEGFWYNPETGDHEELGAVFVITYVTNGRKITEAYLEPHAFRPQQSNA